MSLVRTGISGLDQLLNGGFLIGNAVLLSGAPGTGKTTFGLQYICKGITEYGEPGLVLTFEEFPETLYRDALNFGWDLRELEQKGMLRIVFTSPEILREEIEHNTGIIMESAREIGARRVLVDSITLLNSLAPDTWDRRRTFYSLINLFRREGLTPILIQEAANESPRCGIPFEEYTVDCVIHVSNDEDLTRRRRRRVEIIKARGQDTVRGKHAFRIDHRGINVYPFLPPASIHSAPPEPIGESRVSSGIEGLDTLLRGGFLRGFMAMVSGATGTGKTTMGLHFIHEGALHGEKGLLVSLEESPRKLEVLTHGYGMDFMGQVDKGMITLEHLPPFNVNASRLYRNILRDIEQKNIKRVVIDGITALQHNMPSEIAFRDWTASLASALEYRGVTTLLTNYVAEMFGVFTIVTPDISMLVDTIIFLRYVEIESVICKGMTVVKMRGSEHDRDIMRYDILSGKGIVVRNRFHGLERVIDGVTRFRDSPSPAADSDEDQK